MVQPEADEKILDVFLEAIKGGIEIEEALYWANQVLVPDRTKRFERKIEEKPFSNTRARFEDCLLEKSAEDLPAICFKVTVDEYAVHIVVQIKRMPSL